MVCSGITLARILRRALAFSLAMVVDCKVEIECVAYKTPACRALRHRCIWTQDFNRKRDNLQIPAVDAHGIFLLTAALCAVVALVLMIAVVKVNPFISLFLASLDLPCCGEMPLASGGQVF